MAACGIPECNHCRIAPVFSRQRQIDTSNGNAVRKYTNGLINDICEEHALLYPIGTTRDYLARDHACLLEDPSKPCSTAKFNTCHDGTLETSCANRGIAIFSRIGPYKGYFINPVQYWCDGTPISTE